MDKHIIIYYISIASSCLCLIPFIISIINFRYVKSYLSPLFLLFLVTVIVETINILFAEAKQTNNYILYYFTIAEFVLISMFYGQFFKTYFKPLLINLLIPVFLLASYIDYRVNGLDSNYNFSPSVESIVLIIYSMALFYYVLKNLIFDNLLTTPVFWINTAILFYFSGNLILFVFSSYLAKNQPEKYAILWVVIHAFFNLLYNIFLSLGFWKIAIK